MNIINLIANDNYIVVNRDLIKLFGLKTAVFLGEVASEYVYFERSEKLDETGFFYSTIENIEDRTGLSRHEQATSIETLANMGILEVERRGMPAKRCFRINASRLLAYMQECENLAVRVLKINNQECENLTNCIPYNKNTEIKNTKNKNTKEINKESPESVEARFEALWKLYPRKMGKADAFKAYKRAIKDGVTDDAIRQGIERYNAYIRREHSETRFIKQGSTWFNGRHWEDDYTSSNSGGRFTGEITPTEELNPDDPWQAAMLEWRTMETKQ